MDLRGRPVLAAWTAVCIVTGVLVKLATLVFQLVS